MSKNIKILLSIAFLIGVLYIPKFSFAEMQVTTQEEEILVQMSPNNPEPYQNVTISISSYSTDLSKAIITWQGDSGLLLSGIGKTSYSFTALGPNTTATFNIIIKPVGSINTITKKISISPSEINILWEPLNGYVPPFYKGKALSIKGGMIKVVAIPNTNTIKSKNGNISYTWKNNNEVIQDSSGYNKNSYIFKDDVFDNKNQITVTASSIDENYNAENTIEIPSYNPSIIFYKKSPTEGILYNNALNSETVFTDNEMTIVAEPYFLIIKGNEDKIMYTWNVNGDNINTPTKKTELTVKPSSRGGYATISLAIENLNELFQKVTGKLKLTL